MPAQVRYWLWPSDAILGNANRISTNGSIKNITVTDTQYGFGPVQANAGLSVKSQGIESDGGLPSR